MKYTHPTPEALASLDRAMSQAPEGSGERVLQGFAWLADKAVVEEVAGSNRGPWIDLMVRETGYRPEDQPSYCAIALLWLSKRAGAWHGGNGSVVQTLAAAKKAGRWSATPKRGYAAVHVNPDGRTGHMAIVKGAALGMLSTIEANTSPGSAGSQTNGDGLYRKTRLQRWFNGGFFKLSVPLSS